MPDLELSTALVNPSTPVLPLPFQVVVHAQLVEVCLVVMACALLVDACVDLYLFGREEWRSYQRRRATKQAVKRVLAEHEKAKDEANNMGSWDMGAQNAYADHAPDMTKVSSDPRGEITDTRSAIHRGRL